MPSPGSSGKLSVTTPYGTTTSAADFFAVPTGYNAADVQFAGRMAIDGAPLVATTSAAGKTALVLFDGTAGQVGLALEMTSLSMSGGTVTVFGPDGSQLAASSIGSPSTGIPRLARTGTYTVVIAPGTSGSATVHLGTVDLKTGALTIGTIVANQDGSWTIPVSYTVTNAGSVAAQPGWYDVGYLSADGTLSNDDQSSGVLGYQGDALAAGGTYKVSSSLRTSTTTAPGAYTFFAQADGHNVGTTGGTNTDNGSLVETGETNNVGAASVTLH